MRSTRRTSSRARIATALAAVILAPVLLTGCTGIFPVACPAVGYSSSATITLQSPRSGLTLEVCDGEGCEPGPPAEPLRIGGEVEPRDDGDFAELSGSSLDGWSAVFMIGGEPVLGYRLTDEADVIVGEGHMPVDWVRIDGSEQCGGNREARITLPV